MVEGVSHPLPYFWGLRSVANGSLSFVRLKDADVCDNQGISAIRCRKHNHHCDDLLVCGIADPDGHTFSLSVPIMLDQHVSIRSRPRSIRNRLTYSNLFPTPSKGATIKPSDVRMKIKFRVGKPSILPVAMDDRDEFGIRCVGGTLVVTRKLLMLRSV